MLIAAKKPKCRSSRAAIGLFTVGSAGGNIGRREDDRYIGAIAKRGLFMPQIRWELFRQAVIKSFHELIASGLENVKVKVETEKQICLEITSIREYLVFLNAISRMGAIDEKYPLSYNITKEIGGLDGPFPVLWGSTLDYVREKRHHLDRPKFISFCRYPYRKDPSLDTIRSYEYDAKRELKHNFNVNELDLQVVPGRGTVISEEIASLFSLLYFRNKGFMITQYNEYSPPFLSTGASHLCQYDNLPGDPDQIFWHDEVVNELKNRGFLSNGGTLTELTLCRVLGKRKSKTIDECISGVIEIKNSDVGNAAANTKLQGKYLKTLYYDEGVAYAPFDRKTPGGISIFTFDENGIFYYRDPKPHSKPEGKDKFLCHMKEVVKQTLLMNFTLDEIMELVGKQSSMSSVLTELRKLELEKVMDKLESVM